ncbi:hypothetical protein ACFL2H_06370 [Planctomycetota bacterium]
MTFHAYCFSSFMLAVSVSLAAFPSAAIADILPGNFVPNPSFELDEDADGIPDGWLKGGNNPDGDLWETDNPVSGEYHLTLLDEDESSYTSWYATFPIPEDAIDAEELLMQWDWNYEIESENAGDEFRMSLAWRSEGSDIGFTHFVVKDDKPEYVTETLDLFVPIDADEIRLEFVTAGPQLEIGIMQIDDVSIAIPGQAAAGDFNKDGLLNETDIDLLTSASISGNNDLAFDLNSDQAVDDTDRKVWIEQIKKTFFGDSNLDGEFNSSDFVAVFVPAKYETGETASWAEGDWNGDAKFGSSDFVEAFQGAGYEIGPRAGATAVPEPHSIAMLIVASFAITLQSRNLRIRITDLPHVGR